MWSEWAGHEHNFLLLFLSSLADYILESGLKTTVLEDWRVEPLSVASEEPICLPFCGNFPVVVSQNIAVVKKRLNKHVRERTSNKAPPNKWVNFVYSSDESFLFSWIFVLNTLEREGIAEEIAVKSIIAVVIDTKGAGTAGRYYRDK